MDDEMAFDDWWTEHYNAANLAFGAAKDAWIAATLAERDRCARVAKAALVELELTGDAEYIEAAIRRGAS